MIDGFKGCLPRIAMTGDPLFGAEAPIFEETIRDIIPEREWKKYIEDYQISDRPCVRDIKDQGQEGSCTSNGGTQGWQVCAVDQLGDRGFVNLSAISLYKRVGRNPQSGSTVGDNVRELRDVGALPAIGEDAKLTKMGLDPKHVMPHTGFYTQFPSGWEETAKFFRIDEYWDIESMDGFGTALLNGWPVHYGRRGHSILAVALVIKDGQVMVEYANSWEESWGDQGFGYDTVSGLRSAINQYGAYAYRTIVLTDELLKVASE
jgi:hypothetical protein